MPKFSITQPHQLDRSTAIERVHKLLTRIREKYSEQVKDVHEQWNGDDLAFGFRTYGMNFKGKVVIQEDRVDVEGDLPFSAMMFKGKIESAIQRELEKLLA